VKRKRWLIVIAVLGGLCLLTSVLASIGGGGKTAPTATSTPRATATVVKSQPTATVAPTVTPAPTATDAPTAVPVRAVAIPTVRGAPAASASSCDCDSGDTLNCSDFDAWDAQACYLRCKELKGTDVHGLDGNDNGSACEWQY
jgi:hypothetical protein